MNEVWVIRAAKNFDCDGAGPDPEMTEEVPKLCKHHSTLRILTTCDAHRIMPSQMHFFFDLFRENGTTRGTLLQC